MKKALYIFPILALVFLVSVLSANAANILINSVSFNSTLVDQNEYYTSTISGSFPSNTVFDAEYTSTTGLGGYVTAWQSGSVQNHFVSANYPYGFYTLRKLYADVYGQKKEVWSGAVTIEVGKKVFANRIPKGYLDGVASDGIIFGWAYDPNRPSQPINVHIYFDDPAGSGGIFIGSVSTNIYRPDVNKVEGISGNHGFNFNVPQSYKDGRAHTVYAYAIDEDDPSGKSNKLLTDSPKSFTLGSPVNSAPQFSSCRLAQSTRAAGDTATVNYQASDAQNDPFTVTIYWGDGANTIQGNVGTAQYKYTSPGTYSVRATATDSKGASSTTQCGTVTVLSSPPPQRLMVTSVSLSPRQVRQGERYSSTFTGNMPIPVDTVFDAVYDSTAPGQGGYVTAWQTGPFRYHFITNEYPCGVYTLRQLFTTDANVQKYTAWTGAEIVEVIGCAVSNNPPVVSFCNSPSQGTVGIPVAINYQISDPDGDAFTVRIEWDDGTATNGGISSAQHTYNVPGTYRVTIFATDSKSATTIKSCGTITVRSVIPPTNVPPVILSCSPANAQVQTGNLAAINYQVFDPNGDSVRITVEWGDGTSSDGSLTSASHTYNSAGTFNTIIFAIDSKGATSIKSCGTITVTSLPPPPNRQPVINSCSPANSPVTLGNSATINYAVSDPDGDTFTVTVDWGDGTSSTGSTSSASHTYASTGTFTITITARDSKGAETSRACSTITVNPPTSNRAPVISSCTPPSSSVAVGASATINYAILDPDGDSFTVTVIWGDGTSSTGSSSSASHVYTAAGTYTLTILARDSRGAEASRSCGTITVTSAGGNNAPVINSCSPASSTVSLGGTSTINYAVSDPDGDAFTVVVNWGDGTAPSTGSSTSASHTYASAGTFNIIILATDSRGAATSRQCSSITVTSGAGPGPSGTAKLKITDVDVKVDGRTSNNLKDNDEINKEAKPESNVEFKVEVSSLFTNAENLDIEDITVTITIDGIDDGDDLDDESKEFDLSHGDDKTVTLKFQLPLNVDEGSFDVSIEAEGEDENGTEHRNEINIDLEVEKEKHDLRLLRLNANKQSISCNESFIVNYELINLGQEDEDKAFVEIKNDDLGLNFVQKDLSLESGTEDNSVAKSHVLKTGNTVDDGNYPITINAFADDGKLMDSKTLQLEVKNCKKKETKAVPTADATYDVVETEKVERTLQIPIIEVLFKGANTSMILLVVSAFLLSIFFLFVAVAAFVRAEE